MISMLLVEPQGNTSTGVTEIRVKRNEKEEIGEDLPRDCDKRV